MWRDSGSDFVSIRYVSQETIDYTFACVVSYFQLAIDTMYYVVCYLVC